MLPSLVRAADTKVRVAGLVNDPNVLLPLRGADQLGYFKKAGVSVTMSGYNGGSAAMEGLAAGAADVAVFIPGGMSLAVANGVKAKMIGSLLLGYVGWHMLVRADSPYKSVKDLSGKKVGITSAGSNTDLLTRWASKDAGIETVRVPVGGAGLGPSLLSGTVDAVLVYPPASYALLNGGKARSVYDFEKMPQMIQSCWVASDKAIAENADGLTRMLRACYAAIIYEKKNPAYAQKLIESVLKMDAAVAKQEFDATVVPFSSDGTFTDSALKLSLDLVKLAGAGNIPPTEDLVTRQFVPVKPIEG
jgi:NitT/TauT family transport system substrate-binding protein